MKLKEIKLREIKIPFRKIGRGLLFVLATVLLGGAGYAGAYFVDDYLGRETVEYQKSNSQVYKSEVYNLGMRYPLDWEVEEIKPTLVVFTPVVEEGSAQPKEHLSLRVASNAARGATACETDQTACSFHANGIFGERITTPDEESVFFSKNGEDFTLTLHKYGENDFSDVFDNVIESLRFTSAAEEGDDQGN